MNTKVIDALKQLNFEGAAVAAKATPSSNSN